MRRFYHAMQVAGLAASVSFAAFAWAQAPSQENATVKTNPGFDKNGRINPGEAHQVPSASGQKLNLPTPAESRKAVMMPDQKDPAPGKPTGQATSGGGASGGQQQESQNAIGGPLTPGASARTQSGSQGTSGETQQSASTTGTAPAESANWPIASTGQTAPAKFSERNDILDRTPIMAIPKALSDEDRSRIFKEVMADKAAPAGDAAELAPASELTTQLAFNDMHPLPPSVASNDWISKLKFVKTKDKVFLVEPSTRIVVEQLTQ
jgi:hypothetical protein